FGVELSPHAAVVFEEISERCYGGISFGAIGEQAPLPAPVESSEPVAAPAAVTVPSGDGLRLVTYRPLFPGAAVERTPERSFQGPDGEVELSPADARSRGIRTGDEVTVRSNGTSLALRARVARDLAAGVVRMPLASAEGLHELVEV